MAVSSKPPSNGFVALMRKIYNPLGFSHGYNFVFFLIFGLPMIGFCAYSMPMIDVDKVFCGPNGSSAPGECFYYRRGLPRIGMFIHLAGVLPGSILACFQFVPFIRHKFILFHRINGYIILMLAIVGAVGGLLIARNAFGGGLDVQSAAGAIFILFCTALIMAYINIKRLQIEQHRAWMLRAWFYGGTIIMARIVTFITAAIISKIGGYYVARSCEWLEYTVGETQTMLELYPECSTWAAGENPGQMTVVSANWLGGTSAAEAAAAMSIPFGMAVWLGLAIHAAGVEIYLHLTPGEADRLRKISYQRQVAAGMRHPGSAGLTSDRLGDANQWSLKNIDRPESHNGTTATAEETNASRSTV